MDYDFGSIGNGGVLFFSPWLTEVPSEVPIYFGVQIYGDRSQNMLGLKVEDATGEGFGKGVATINWSGWQQVASAFDSTWWHGGGDNDGVFDPPASRIGVAVEQRPGAAHSGRIFADEMALTFPMAGQQVIEDFEGDLVRLQLTMLGTPSTTVVVGDGPDANYQAIPFAMARREAQETVFSALFEPFRTSPRITLFEALSVVPDPGLPLAFRVASADFADSLLLTDGDPVMYRAFGDFSSDATLAYVRQEPEGNVRTTVLVSGTELSKGALSVLTCTLPITVELEYSDTRLSLTMPSVPTAQLRVYAPGASVAFVNGWLAPFERDGLHVLIPLPPNPARLFLPVVLKNH